ASKDGKQPRVIIPKTCQDLGHDHQILPLVVGGDAVDSVAALLDHGLRWSSDSRKGDPGDDTNVIGGQELFSGDGPKAHDAPVRLPASPAARAVEFLGVAGGDVSLGVEHEDEDF